MIFRGQGRREVVEHVGRIAATRKEHDRETRAAPVEHLDGNVRLNLSHL